MVRNEFLNNLLPGKSCDLTVVRGPDGNLQSSGCEMAVSKVLQPLVHNGDVVSVKVSSGYYSAEYDVRFGGASGGACGFKQYLTRSEAYSSVRYEPSFDELQQINRVSGPAGRNNLEIKFTFRCLKKGLTSEHTSWIYVWEWNVPVVVFDIDGTITRSDDIGQLSAGWRNFDWVQDGVVRMANVVKARGYNILYLSARPISQAPKTSDFLWNVRQNGEFLPKGPVVLSGDGFWQSLYKEVILGASDEFKTRELQKFRLQYPTVSPAAPLTSGALSTPPVPTMPPGPAAPPMSGAPVAPSVPIMPPVPAYLQEPAMPTMLASPLDSISCKVWTNITKPASPASLAEPAEPAWPFHAGFGNRNTDLVSYLKVGIPKERIWTLNVEGKLINSGGNEVDVTPNYRVVVLGRLRCWNGMP